MRNIFKNIKDTLRNAFQREGSSKEAQEKPVVEYLYNKGPVNPGLEEKRDEDVGKKVFEKTGQLREGVGQSSTLNSQENPPRTNQGMKHRRRPNKNYYPKDPSKNNL